MLARCGDVMGFCPGRRPRSHGCMSPLCAILRTGVCYSAAWKWGVATPKNLVRC